MEKSPLVLVQVAVQQSEQAGLAGAVAADQTDLFAGVDRHRGIVEQHLGATAQAEILEDDHAIATAHRARAARFENRILPWWCYWTLERGKAFATKDAKGKALVREWTCIKPGLLFATIRKKKRS
jgi:hypothetical protein